MGIEPKGLVDLDLSRLLGLAELHDSGWVDVEAVIAKLKGKQAKELAVELVSKPPEKLSDNAKAIRRLAGLAA